MENKDVRNRAEYEPTLAAQKLVEALLDPANRFKTKREICTIADISSDSYYRLMNDPDFKAWYKAQSVNMTAEHIGPILATYVKEAKSGSIQHGNAILDMNDVYSPKQKVEHTGSSGGPVQFIMTGLDTWRKEVEPEEGV